MPGSSGTSPSRRRLLALAALALAGCGGSGGPEEAGYVASLGADGRPAPLGCEDAVPTRAVPAPDALIVPGSARVLLTKAQPNPGDPAVTIVEGYIEETPTGMIARFQSTPGVEIVASENEDIEADVLVSDGRRTSFWKAVRTCLAGSRFAAATGAAKAVARHGRRAARRPLSPARP